MKPVSPELLTLLASREFYVADLYTFSGGNLGTTVLRYTSGDQDIVANGFTYSSGGVTGPYFDRSDSKAQCHWKIGTSSDTLTFGVIPAKATVFNVSFSTAVKYGLFDGAAMMLERAYMPTYGDTSVGVVRLFLGRIASIDSGRSMLNFNIASQLELLNLQLPRNLYQATCRNSWGDKGCGVVQSGYTTTAVVSSTSTSSAIICNITGTFPTGTFDQGKVVFTTGVNLGVSASIKSVAFGSPSTISLLGYLPQAPGVTDAFTLYYGCDKTQGANGCAKFANLARFRAEPLIPQPTVLL